MDNITPINISVILDRNKHKVSRETRQRQQRYDYNYTARKEVSDYLHFLITYSNDSTPSDSDSLRLNNYTARVQSRLNGVDPLQFGLLKLADVFHVKLSNAEETTLAVLESDDFAEYLQARVTYADTVDYTRKLKSLILRRMAQLGITSYIAYDEAQFMVTDIIAQCLAENNTPQISTITFNQYNKYLMRELRHLQSLTSDNDFNEALYNHEVNSNLDYARIPNPELTAINNERIERLQAKFDRANGEHIDVASVIAYILECNNTNLRQRLTASLQASAQKEVLQPNEIRQIRRLLNGEQL